MTIMNNEIKVIIRGAEDEPFIKKITGWMGNRIELSNITGDDNYPLSYRKDLAYKFDEDLYNDLNRAFKRGDFLTLSRLWYKAEHFDNNE